MVTLVTIFVCKSLAAVDVYMSNVIGYALGVLNSFIWNKQWVFHSDGGYRREALRFACGFMVCYALQLAVVVALNSSAFGNIELCIYGFVISGYGIATLIGCAVYTLSNFIYNRLVTFR